MLKGLRRFISFVIMAVPAASPSVVFAGNGAKPRVFLLSADTLVEQKQKLADLRSAPADLKTALARLDLSAQKALTADIRSVVTKLAVPPSGDKHDYMSQAPYFWKNPDTKDGFPYIRRDGERNPEIANFPDHELMDKMVDAVERLSVGYYFTGKEAYAARASEILRMWFIDAKTKMNPNLEYAQAIPGQNTGRGIGIIETRGLTRVVDAIGLLDGARAWSKADQQAIESWFSNYLDWLTTSKNGRDERAAKNNHGTFYDVQAASFALFTGRTAVAKTMLEAAKQDRIAKQIEPDGRQPLETERTKSWSYSTMNLEGLVSLAVLGDRVGVDLWNFKTHDGRGIRKAIDFLYPFAAGESKWTFQQIEDFQPERLFASMRRSAGKYPDVAFKHMMAKVPPVANDDRVKLTGF